MRDRGLVGTFAEPIRLRTATLGSLCVFADHDQGHDDRDVVVIQMLADAASAALVRQRDQGRMQTLDEQVRDILDARIPLEQAKGALSRHRGVEIEEAFQLLCTRARSAGRGARGAERGARGADYGNSPTTSSTAENDSTASSSL